MTGHASETSAVPVTVVAPMRDEAAAIGALIDDLLAQSVSPSEIVLVDGGSTDDTAAIAQQLVRDDARFRVVEAGPATPGRGRNVGITAASHEWVALIDVGVRPETNWLERLLEPVRRAPTLDVVYGGYEPEVNTWFEACASLAYVEPPSVTAEGVMRWPFAASLLIRRSAWEAAGRFPDLRAAEDLIFFERLAASPAAAAWAPGATVWWQMPTSLAATFRRFRLYSRHNVLAGRQRYWHRPVARHYAVAAPIVVAGIVWPWALSLLPVAALARVLKRIWFRRDTRGPLWVLNPARVLTVGTILATIDLATLLGWVDARAERRRDRPQTIGPAPDRRAERL
jgi:glycosyltransferase involved in cell wall biosynthesis